MSGWNIISLNGGCVRCRWMGLCLILLLWSPSWPLALAYHGIQNSLTVTQCRYITITPNFLNPPRYNFYIYTIFLIVLVFFLSIKIYFVKAVFVCYHLQSRPSLFPCTSRISPSTMKPLLSWKSFVMEIHPEKVCDWLNGLFDQKGNCWEKIN